MLYSVFTYGTLQVPEVMAAVTGMRPDFEEAILPGHACYRLQHRIYPGTGPCSGGFIRGRLYHGINDLTLKYLDAFEDVLYQRRLLAVSTCDSIINAQVYIIADEYRDLLLPEPWHLEEFVSNHLARYLDSCHRFYQKMSTTMKPGVQTTGTP